MSTELIHSPPELDQILGPVGDPQVAVWIHGRHIAGAQPAIGGGISPAR